MATHSDRKFEFRDWMDTQKLKVSAVCSRFGISEQTAFNWRSKGVPKSRQDFVSRVIAEWSNASAIGPRIQVQATDAQFRAWNLAANDCENGPKTIEEWARDGLNELAREYFSNPQLSLPLRSLPKHHEETTMVAEDSPPYRVNGGPLD